MHATVGISLQAAMDRSAWPSFFFRDVWSPFMSLQHIWKTELVATHGSFGVTERLLINWAFVVLNSEELL